MAMDITIDAARVAMGLQQLRAEVASMNIANAGSTHASRFKIDAAGTTNLLELASGGSSGLVREALANTPSPTMATASEEETSGVQPSLDELVTESVMAGLNYQTLSESLSRHFGLMRLAITGRN
ncbi:MAG TPA: hypothetical protein VGC19_10930 [Rhodanobacter sp.]